MVNPVCWIDFHGMDVAKKSKFFQDVFGWECSPLGERYALWTSGEGEIGGGLNDEGEPKTIAYISVDDIEASLKSIAENGGKTVLPKSKLDGDHGFIALFTDCCGTTVGLWSKT